MQHIFLFVDVGYKDCSVGLQIFPIEPHQAGMERIEVDNTILQVKTVLAKGGSNEDYTLAIAKLGVIVSATSQDEHFRASLAEDFSLLDLVVDVVTNSLLVDLKDPEARAQHVRLLRGVLVFLRNLVASTNVKIDIPMLLLNVQHLISNVKKSNQFFTGCLSAFIEILANISLRRDKSFHCKLQLVSQTFEPVLESIMKVHDERQPFITFLNGVFTDDDNVSSLLGDQRNEPLLGSLLIQGYGLLSGDGNVNQHTVWIFEKVVSNKGFKTWIESRENTEEFMSILKVARLVITTEKEWDNTQCTLILDWVYSFFQKWSQIAIELLYAEIEDPKLADINPKLIIILDIISDLMKYHQAVLFLEHYSALDPLIGLLRAAHENGEISTMKQSRVIPATAKKHFPMVKSLIVEILAYLLHDSFENQESVRELHALELLLSNCIIDDNNPYIKERSILCLKFALKNNPKNQEFVAELEAQDVVDDEALQQAGFEVSVDDGKVKLKKVN